MTLHFHCPQCNSPKSIADQHAGKLGKCKCGAVLQIPQLDRTSAESDEEDYPILDWAPDEHGSSEGIFGDLLPSADANYQPTTQSSSSGYYGSQPLNNRYQDSKTTARGNPRNANTKQGYTRDKPDEQLDNLKILGGGGIIGVFLAGPLMLAYGTKFQSTPFYVVGLLLSIFWVPVGFCFRYGIYFGIDGQEIFSEVFGFKELSNRAQWIRAGKMYLATMFSMLTFFGLFWVIVAATTPAIMSDTEEQAPVPRIADIRQQEADRIAEQQRADLLLKQQIDSELERLAPEVAAKLAPKKETVAAETLIPTEYIERWQACVESPGPNYLEKMLRQFGANKEIVASPSGRFVLHHQKLYDLETSSKKILNGRRYGLVSPANANRLVPLEISPDGEFILYKLMNDGMAKENGISLVVQSFDNSLVKVLPDCEEGYFLAPDKLLVRESSTGQCLRLSGADFSKKDVIASERLLAIGETRRYAAFGRTKSPADFGVNNKSASDVAAAEKAQLVIKDLVSNEEIAIAAYEGLTEFEKGFFSRDGRKLLLVGNQVCTAISLSDGKRGPLLELKPNQLCEGWCGTESTYVCASTFSDSSEGDVFSFGDVEIGIWVARFGPSNGSPPWRVFRSLGLRGQDNSSDIYVFPVSNMKSRSVLYSMRKAEAVPKAVRLTVMSDGEPYIAIKAIMSEFVTKSLGLECNDSSFNVQLEVKLTQVEESPMQLSMVATDYSNNLLWEASTQLERDLRFSRELEKQRVMGPKILFSLTNALNKTIEENPFPEVLPADLFTYDNDILLAEQTISVGLPDDGSFKISENLEVDNRWYGTNPLLDTTRLPLLDYTIPLDFKQDVETQARVIGFWEDKGKSAIVFQHPIAGVCTLDLRKKGERAKIEIGEAFTELCVDNAKKDLLILYENQIQRLDLATKKKTKLITLPESTKRMAISPDGKTLAVALTATILFYDLSNLQEGRSSPAKPILEVSGYIQHGPMLFSQNGKWFVGVGGGNAQRGYLVDLEKGSTVNLWPKPEGSYFSVGDRGKVHYFDLMGRAIESEADSNGKLSMFKQLKIEPLRAPLASHISPDGTKMIPLNREGRIEVLAFPSGELIEGIWDPGCVNDFEFFRGGSGWSPSGKYFYWVQRNRIIVWESLAN